MLLVRTPHTNTSTKNRKNYIEFSKIVDKHDDSLSDALFETPQAISSIVSNNWNLYTNKAARLRQLNAGALTKETRQDPVIHCLAHFRVIKNSIHSKRPRRERQLR